MAKKAAAKAQKYSVTVWRLCVDDPEEIVDELGGSISEKEALEELRLAAEDNPGDKYFLMREVTETFAEASCPPPAPATITVV